MYKINPVNRNTITITAVSQYRPNQYCWVFQWAGRKHETTHHWTGNPETLTLRRQLCRNHVRRVLRIGAYCTIVLEEGATEGIHVGVWVLDLADFAQNSRNGVEALSGQITNVVILDVLVSKALQMHEPGISVPKHSMAVARDNSTFLQGLIHKLFNFCLVWSFALMELFQIGQPFQAFLVSQPMEGTSKSIHSSRVGEIGVSKGRAHKMASMCGNIPALVIGMNW